jgi:hypothetical protein
VVVQIDAGRFAAVAIPLKDKPLLFVDPDRMEAFEMTTQLSLDLERIAFAYAICGAMQNRHTLRTSVLFWAGEFVQRRSAAMAFAAVSSSKTIVFKQEI